VPLGVCIVVVDTVTMVLVGRCLVLCGIRFGCGFLVAVELNKVAVAVVLVSGLVWSTSMLLAIVAEGVSLVSVSLYDTV
jgi:hypothetical protein